MTGAGVRRGWGGADNDLAKVLQAGAGGVLAGGAVREGSGAHNLGLT